MPQDLRSRPAVRHHPPKPCRQRAISLLLLLPLAACTVSRPEAAREAALRLSISRGLSCVARAYDGNSFDDSYLRFEYPGEAIASPLPGYHLTYRVLDAYFIVLMIQQAGVNPGEARTLFERADAATAALVPEWRKQGIYNLRRAPVAGGIALDTYAIVAVLRRDVAMARVVGEGLDGDGWLRPDFYADDEAFRVLADESWAARALLVVDPVKGDAAVRGVIRRIARAVATEPDREARANLVIHALEAASDRPPPTRARHEAGSGRSGDELSGLRAEGLRLIDDPAIGRDTLTLGNLAGALLVDGATATASIDPVIQEIERRQDPDGCWAVSLDAADESARIFATLRMVLTLGRYEASGPGA